MRPIWNPILGVLKIESEPTLVTEIENDDNYYIKVDKKLKKEDVIRGVRNLVKPSKKFTSEFVINT